MSADRITPVILSGGAGSRLWPVSTPARPKQLHALTGSKSMLRLAAERVADPALFAAPIVVAAERHAAQVEEELAEAGTAPAILILEPSARNTSAAIALAALTAAPDALLLVTPSDHVIADQKAFYAAVQAGAAQARQGHLVTFGITPDRPETGYGYIRRGAPLAGAIWRVAEFVEKPDRETAVRYLGEGGFTWNAGIFLFEAGAMLAALEAQAPDILQGVRRALAKADRRGSRVRPDPAEFAGVRAVSIDYAVMERHERIAVVEADMGWSDVGSWDSLYLLGAKDRDGNLVQGEAVAPDSSGCLIRSDGPLVVATGVQDLIVVATGDAVIILPRGESQRVKDALAAADQRAPRRSGR